MKYKDYLKKHEKIIRPIDKQVPRVNMLSTLQMLAEEIGGGFNERVQVFVEKEKDIILNSEVDEEWPNLSLLRRRMKMEDEEYLDEKFPKGDKRRGEAMVLLALARQSGEELGYEKAEKDFNGER